MRWRLLCSGAVLTAALVTALAAQQPSPAAQPAGAPAAPVAATAAPVAAEPSPSTAPVAPPAAGAEPAAATAEPAAPAPTVAIHGKAGFDPTLVYVFMLATFIGLGVITRVSRLLHTPLMSLTNAISAIAVVGSIVIAGEKNPFYITVLGAIALFASMTNIVSGFLITDRMLKMFRKREVGK